MKRLLPFFVLLFALPAWAQLGYQTGPAGSAKSQATQAKPDDLPVNVKKTRTSQATVRPDWYALFLLWSKAHPNDVSAGLRDTKSFDNFAQIVACDWVRDDRQNDVIWPAKQIQIIQKFNERELSAQTRFKLLTHGELGPYQPDKQQFTFKPLDGTLFGIEYPKDKSYGMEDDCTGSVKGGVMIPWPAQFVMAFQNPDLINGLPMPKDQAEFFVEALPKTERGQVDRHVVVEVEFDVVKVELDPLKSPQDLPPNTAPPVGVLLSARNAIVYKNMNMSQELARYGLPPLPTAPAPPPLPQQIPVPAQHP